MSKYKLNNPHKDTKYSLNVHDLIVKVKVDEDEKVGKIIAKKLHQDRLISLENFLKNL